MSKSDNQPKKKWPEDYGFSIYGNGPTFVVRVQPSSISEKAGICVGDCIVELDHQNTMNQPADVLKQIAFNSKKQPPEITVQAFGQTFFLKSNAHLSSKSFLILYGFTIYKGTDNLVQVDQIDLKSQAYKSGLRSGDIIIKINDNLINDVEQTRIILKDMKNEPTEIKYISLSKPILKSSSDKYRDKSLPNKMVSDAQALDVVDSVLMMSELKAEPDKKALLSNELKNYQKTRNLQRLVHTLNTVILPYEERKLIENIKNKIIYYDQRDSFEALIKKQMSSSTENLREPVNQVYTDCVSSTNPKTNISDLNKTLDKKIVPNGKRRLAITKYAYEPLGITLKKEMKPPQVSSVTFGSVAQNSGLLEDDIILSVNGINVEDKSSDEITKFLQYQNLDIEVIQKAEYKQKLDKPKKNSLLDTESDYFETHDSESIDGYKFKQAVRKVLNKTEKSKLKQILIGYNDSKNVEKMIEKTNRLLDTPAKRELWPYLEQVIDKGDTQFLNNHTTDSEKSMTKYNSKVSPSYKHTKKLNRKIFYGSQNIVDTDDVVSLRSLKASKQFLSSPSLNSFHVKKSDGPVANMSKQLDYLLNFYDKNEFIRYLEDYDASRDIYTLVQNINALLDTSAKRTLWFHLIPLLDEDDQEFCKRKLSVKDFNFVQEKGIFSIDKLSNYQNIIDEIYILTDTEIDALFVSKNGPKNNRLYRDGSKNKRRENRNQDNNKRFSYSSTPSNNFYLMNENLKNDPLQKSDYEFEVDSNRIREMHDYIKKEPEPKVYSYFGDYKLGY